ncbi:MAG: glycosyltransferase family 4 protein [Candidatus Hydrogenedentes bacterium]|nr:glycosyltransferase family 4 protein [Candidatus Hydrogenedentota bacterium]
MEQRAIAYLVSEYPAISHTFIFREIQAVRALGLTVKTASARKPEHLDRMTLTEKVEAAQTFYMKTAGVGRLIAAQARVLARNPRAYLRMAVTWARLARQGRVPVAKRAAYWAGAVLLLDWMTAQGIGHVHVHLANPSATVAMIAAAGGTITYSMSVHGPDVFYNVDANLLAEKVKRAVFVRCISHYCRSQLMRVTPPQEWARLHIVRCGVDVDAFKPRPAPENAVPEILCVGRLVPAKGQQVLLQACRELKLRGVAFHLTLVGDGPDRGTLEHARHEFDLADAVTLAGAVGQDAIQEYYNRADVFVLASFAEGLPVVLMEAMATCVPCIATRITGIPELITDGYNGILVAASARKELADQLERVLEDPELRAKLGRRGRRRVAADYDNEANARRMAELFQDLLAKEG